MEATTQAPGVAVDPHLLPVPAKLWGDVEVSLPGGEAMQLVRLEAGTFLMGTTLAQKRRWDAFNAQKHPLSFSAIPYSSEFPQHPVTLTKAFYMGAYEVTRGQWFAVLDSSRQVRRPRRAMSNVSWLEVLHFIAALNELSGRTFRLPTEAEWEYAARAGTETLWFSGDDPKKALLELHLHRGFNPLPSPKQGGMLVAVTSRIPRSYTGRYAIRSNNCQDLLIRLSRNRQHFTQAGSSTSAGTNRAPKNTVCCRCSSRRISAGIMRDTATTR